MADASLEGCWAKHRRGVEHLDALDDAMHKYLGREPKPYALGGQFHRDRCEYVVVGEITEPMADLAYWGAVFGDVLHNFRSALDLLVCQLVLLNTGKECTAENGFPICSSGAQYWSIGKKGEPSLRDRRLRGVADQHKAFIDTLQPYRTQGRRPNQVEALAGLSALSNLDKHRLIHPTLFAPDAHDAAGFALHSNEDAGDMTGQSLAALSEDRETEILTVTFSCPGPNPDVSVEGELPIGVGFGKAPVRLPAFFTVSEHIESILKACAPAFP